MPEDSDAVVRTFALTQVFRDFWLREKVTAVRKLDLSIHKGEVSLAGGANDVPGACFLPFLPDLVSVKMDKSP